jgi:hypothetical protein
MTFNPFVLVESIIDRADVPWFAGGSELVSAVKAYDKAQADNSDALIDIEDAEIGLIAAEQAWKAESVDYFDKTGELLTKDSVELAEITLASAKRKQTVTQTAMRDALGKVTQIILAEGFIDKWREALTPEIKTRQDRLAKIASDMVQDVSDVELMLLFSEWLGVFPTRLPYLPTTSEPVGILMELVNKQPWVKPKPDPRANEVKWQHEIEPDTRPDVWVVTNGQTEEISAAQYDGLKKNVNIPHKPRLATPAEITKATRKK